ncbi:MAG: alanine dehydrogenase [Desulfovibrionales bacterium]|nr:MAG: alanine dehydrogenase [Desulfovibrionales bacterium]
MRIGVPKEIKAQERRVGLFPSGVKALVEHGHEVIVESGAGEGCGALDDVYRSQGAQIGTAEQAWGQELVVKVKEPLDEEYRYLREDLTLFTYLHLAANKPLTDALVRSGCVAIAYETVQLPDKSLPLLAPMSEIAGRMSVTKAAEMLCHYNGGNGVFLGGVTGTLPARVVVIGAGISGSGAAQMAVGLGADIVVLDVDMGKIYRLYHHLDQKVKTLFSNALNIEDQVLKADVVVSCVLIPGAFAPKLITKQILESMKPGAVIMDIAIDQGGSTELSRPTTHDAPCLRVGAGVNLYCVANMPGAYPRTASESLTNATLRYAIELADKGWPLACRENPALAQGLNVVRGKVVYKAVAEACGYEWSEF